ncbi:MAG: hypothetical protein RLZZ20_2566, partial [Pseudomonadota bacterium]
MRAGSDLPSVPVFVTRGLRKTYAMGDT